jgi:hypothetical protein
VPFEKRGAIGYRNLVQTYSKACSEMGLSQTVNQSTFRALEWYVTNSLEDSKLLEELDGMDGRPFYFDLVTKSAVRLFHQLERGIASDDM